MAGTTVSGRLGWLLASVSARRVETSRSITLHLEADTWPGHLPGQHVDVRLTAPDGYRAQRSYSIASAPRPGHLELTVEDLDDGEVSPYLSEELQPGDQLELRGPIGGYFTWTEEDGGPLLLVAGGSGIVPLMSMLRYRHEIGSTVPTTLLYSSRAWDEIIYRDELEHFGDEDGLRVIHTLTRSQPDGWDGYTRRIDAAMLEAVAGNPPPNSLAYICGPTPLVESVANGLVLLNYAAGQIKTERFGPTGG